MSRETDRPAGSAGAAADVCGAVVVAHGGREVGTGPVTPLQPAVLRMVPLAYAIRHALRGSGVVVFRPRYQLQGWNGELASPVDDLGRVLDQIGTQFGGIPVVLIGHSMGARAAFRVAGHSVVSRTGPAITSVIPRTPGPTPNAPAPSPGWPRSR
jgi:pimeloyl-ACP methyl ester carboxylesterase